MGEIGEIWVSLTLRGLSAFDSGMAQVTQRMTQMATAAGLVGRSTTPLANSLAAWLRATGAAANAAAAGWRSVAAAIRTVNAAAGLAQGGLRVLGTAATATAQVNAAAMRIIRDDLGAVASAVHNVASIMRNLPTLVIPVLGHITSAFRSAFDGIVGLAKGAANLITYPFRKLFDFIFSLKGMVAALGMSLSAYGIGKYLIDVTADAENARISFTAFLGSEARAVQMLKEIKRLADTTPLELPEVRDSARAMVAFGFSAESVAGRLRMLGDVSQGLSLPLQDLVQIYGKVHELGKVQGDTFRQFGRRGIPVLSELATILGKSKQEVRDMGSKGLISFAHLEMAFKRLTGEGGRFHDLLTEKGKSITGRFSTMHDSLRSIGEEIGGSLAPILKSAIDGAINLLNRVNERLGVYRERIAEWAKMAAGKVEAFGVKLLGAFSSAEPYVVEFVKLAVSVKTAIGEITSEVAGMVVQWVGGNAAIGAGLMGAMKWVRFLADNWRLLGPLGVAYINNWAEAGAHFVTEFTGQFGRNLSQLFRNILPALKTFGQILSETVIGAIKAAKRELPFWLGGGGAEDKTAFNRVKNLTQVLANQVADAFDNTNDPADQSQQKIDRDARRRKMGQGPLPGFDFGKVFSKEIPEVAAALKKLSEAKLEWDAADAMKDAMNAMFEMKRKMEADQQRAFGGGGGDVAEAGGRAGKGDFGKFMDPIAFYKSQQAAALDKTKARDDRQAADIHAIAEAVTAPQRPGRPMPAMLA